MVGRCDVALTGYGLEVHPVVVMGVSGSGKSTVAAALSQRLRVPFEDADDLHPAANIAKMSRGEALDDTDRWPWLDVVGAWLADRPEGGVMACSALKRVYRDRLRGACPGLVVVHLAGDVETIRRRQASRPGHFMPASLLTSQFSTLEPLDPTERGVTVDVGPPVDQVVEHVVRGLDTLAQEEE